MTENGTEGRRIDFQQVKSYSNLYTLNVITFHISAKTSICFYLPRSISSPSSPYHTAL